MKYKTLAIKPQTYDKLRQAQLALQAEIEEQLTMDDMVDHLVELEAARASK